MSLSSIAFLFFTFFIAIKDHSMALHIYMHFKIASSTSLTEPYPRSNWIEHKNSWQKPTEKLVFQVDLQGLALFFLLLYSWSKKKGLFSQLFLKAGGGIAEKCSDKTTSEE